MAAPARLILVHKHRTSARTLFLRFPDGIVTPEALPKLSQVLGEDEAVEDATVVAHPAMLIKQAAAALGLEGSDIQLESDFHANVDTPQGVAPIYLGEITTVDAPLAAVERGGGHFIAITEARDLSPAELELLRRAYTAVME